MNSDNDPQIRYYGGAIVTPNYSSSKTASEVPQGFVKKEETDCDRVNHPSHYTSHPSGVECITITRHYINDIGNAIKYLWRAGLKNEDGYSSKEKEIEDLEKAIFYINDRIKMLKGEV